MAKAITRLVKKGRLANPRHGVLLILRPEDQLAGAPGPVRWIDPLSLGLVAGVRSAVTYCWNGTI